MAADENSWRTQTFRQSVVAKIDEAIQKSGMPTSKNSIEMENHVFQKAKTKEEYLGFVARLILHVREMNSKRTVGGIAPGPGGGGGQGMPDPIGALQTLARQGTGNNQMMGMAGPGPGPQGMVPQPPPNTATNHDMSRPDDTIPLIDIHETPSHTSMGNLRLSTTPTSAPAQLGKRSSESAGIYETTISSKNMKSDSPPARNAAVVNPLPASTFVVPKKELDMQIVRSLLASSTSFATINHSEVKSMFSMLRPDYILPTKEELIGPLFEAVFEIERKKCYANFSGKTLCLRIHNRSTVQDENVTIITVTTEDGNHYVYDIVDATGRPNIKEYLTVLAKSVIKKLEEDHGYRVTSLVTNDVVSMTEMHSALKQNDNILLVYSCSKHILNLLSVDFGTNKVRAQIIRIVRYFRNDPHASRKYKQAGGRPLVMSRIGKWNDMVSSLEEYLSELPNMMSVCENNKEFISPVIAEKVEDTNMKQSVEELLALLKPMAVVYARLQKKGCIISDAVEAWKKLEADLGSLNLKSEKMNAFRNRYDMALTPCHFLAYLMDPRMTKFPLTDDETSSAFAFANKSFPGSGLAPLVKQMRAQAPPFCKLMFCEDIIKEFAVPLHWWKFWKDLIKSDELLMIVSALLTAAASSIGVNNYYRTIIPTIRKMQFTKINVKFIKMTLLAIHFNSDKGFQTN